MRAFRFRVAILAGLMIGAALVPVLLLAQQPDAHAEALIVARQLDMDAAALPGYAESVFANGRVADAVADVLPDVEPEDVVPARVSLQAQPDSIVLLVDGHADDPEEAAAIANAAADAFVIALNEPGTGVGTFALQLAAQPTERPSPRLASTTDGLIAMLAVGMVLGLGVAAVLLLPRGVGSDV